jgi:hypothetical protein
VAVADVAGDAADSWWIIGSAAVALVGGAVDEVRDVDVLMSSADASNLLARVGSGPARREPDQRFSSDVFGTWKAPPLPVEFMGGFCYCSTGLWRPVRPVTRDAVGVDGRTLFVPSAAELKALLLGFGRDKDIARAALIPA